MRLLWLILLALGVILIVGFLVKKIIKSTLCKVVAVIVAIFIFCGGGTLINLNTLSADLQKKLDSVSEVLGDSVIRQKGNTIEVKFGDDWYDVSKLWVDGNGSDRTITYDGKEIPVGKTGIASTVDVLEGIGLIKRK